MRFRGGFILIVCAFLIVNLGVASAANGHASDSCLAHFSELGYQDAGAEPETAMDRLPLCHGHLKMDVDEVDMLKDPVPYPAGWQLDYSVRLEASVATMTFQLLWIDATSTTLLDEQTLTLTDRHGSEPGQLLGQVPDGSDLSGRAFIRIQLDSSEEILPKHGDSWTVV